jgi:hypothetical protein
MAYFLLPFSIALINFLEDYLKNIYFFNSTSQVSYKICGIFSGIYTNIPFFIIIFKCCSWFSAIDRLVSSLAADATLKDIFKNTFNSLKGTCKYCIVDVLQKFWNFFIAIFKRAINFLKTAHKIRKSNRICLRKVYRAYNF